jgi:hypothetical protein
MKRADGGGWPAVALGAALAAPWLLLNVLSEPPTQTEHEGSQEAASAYGAGAELEQNEWQVEASALEWLADVGIEPDELITIPGTSVQLVRYCQELKPSAGGIALTHWKGGLIPRD